MPGVLLSECVARAVRRHRLRLGLTQDDLGRAIGLAQHVVSSIETDVRDARLDELPALCRALGVTLDDLLDGIDDADALALRPAAALTSLLTHALGRRRIASTAFLARSDRPAA